MIRGTPYRAEHRTCADTSSAVKLAITRRSSFLPVRQFGLFFEICAVKRRTLSTSVEVEQRQGYHDLHRYMDGYSTLVARTIV